jgi:hypothetical protein
MKVGVNVKNTVTQEQIDRLINKAEIYVDTVFDKCTVVTCKLENGFVISESTGAVSKENYDEGIGKEICLNRIKDTLWFLEGYKLACELMER